MADNQHKDNRGRKLPPNVYQRPNGYYYYQYYDSEGNRRTFGSYRLKARDPYPRNAPECKRGLPALEDMVREHQSREQLGIIKTKDEPTMNELFEMVLADQRGNREQTNINTVRKWEKHVAPYIGEKKVTSVKYIDIKRLYNRISETKKADGTKISSDTLYRMNGILTRCFKIAQKQKLIAENPSVLAWEDISVHLEKTSKKSNKHFALTMSEEDAILEFIKDSQVYSFYYPMVYVGFWSGLRFGELAGLTWSDIDFENRIIDVNHQLTYYDYGDGNRFRIGDTKTEAGTRVVPMVKDVDQVLADLKKKRLPLFEVDGISGFIFSNKSGNPISGADMDRIFKGMCNSYNKSNPDAPIRSFRCHDMRYTFCTRLCEVSAGAGISLPAIQKIMGHQNIKETLDIYNQVTSEHLSDVQKKLDSIF